MHHGGVNGWSIVPGPDPGKTLLVGDPLWHGERPMDGIKFWMSIHTAIVSDIGPRKETRIGCDVPLMFLMQELESCRSLSLNRGGPDAAWPGRDAAVRLDFGWIRAVVGCQVVMVLNGAITVAKGETGQQSPTGQVNRKLMKANKVRMERTDPRPMVAGRRFQSCRFGYLCRSAASARCFTGVISAGGPPSPRL